MNKGTPADPLLAAFDKAVEEELPHVSTIAYNSHDICEWFAVNVRKRLADLATKPAEQSVPKCGECVSVLPCWYEKDTPCIQGHPTESAGKSPEAAGENRATDLMTRYRWAVQAGEVNEEYRQARDALYAALTETQQSSNANGSDEQTSPSVQPPAPEPPYADIHRLLLDVLSMTGIDSRTAPDYAVRVAAWLPDSTATPPPIAQRGALK